MTKCCRRCHLEKPSEEFSSERANKDGLKPYCKPCMAARQRERRLDPEKAERDRITSRAWKLRNPERVKAQWSSPEKKAANIAWARANPEKHRAAVDRYQARNPDKVLAHANKRRARKAAAPVNDFTAADWREVLDEFNHACAYCLVRGVALQQEHMEPLSRGGSHTRSNIVPACGPCNMRKGARSLLGALQVLNTGR